MAGAKASEGFPVVGEAAPWRAPLARGLDPSSPLSCAPCVLDGRQLEKYAPADATERNEKPLPIRKSAARADAMSPA